MASGPAPWPLAGVAGGPGNPARLAPRVLGRLIASTRFLIVVAVLSALVAATTLLVYAGFETFVIVRDLLAAGTVGGKAGKELTLTLIGLVDRCLVSTVLYVIGVGLFELFIDDRLPLPHWLEIHDLDDLKEKLVGVVVVVLAVLFLGEVVTWDGERNLLGLGAGIALVVAALTFFVSQRSRKERSEGQGARESDPA